MLHMFRRIPFILLLALPLLASPIATGQAFAKGIVATVIANEVTIHSGPTADTAEVGKIQRNGIVMVTEVKGTWAHVLWLKDKKAHEGWVLADALRATRTSGGSGGSYVTSGGANFELSIRDTQLHCREDFDGGYSSCTVEISLEYDSDYNGNDLPNVNIECDVELRTTDTNSFTSHKSESESASYYGKSEYGDIEVEFSMSSFDPIVEVKVSDVSCSITDVY